MMVHPKAQIRIDGDQVEIVRLYRNEEEMYTRYFNRSTEASRKRCLALAGKMTPRGRLLVDVMEILSATQEDFARWAVEREAKKAASDARVQRMIEEGTWPGRGW